MQSMSARTRSVSVVIRSVSAPPPLRIDIVGPDPPPCPPAPVLSRLGPVLRVRRPAPHGSPSRPGRSILAPQRRHSELLGLKCARFAADRPRRAALRVRTPGLACCAAGWTLSPPGGRARSESVLAPCSLVMLAQPLSIELIDLPFSHLSHVAVKDV